MSGWWHGFSVFICPMRLPVFVVCYTMSWLGYLPVWSACMHRLHMRLTDLVQFSCFTLCLLERGKLFSSLISLVVACIASVSTLTPLMVWIYCLSGPLLYAQPKTLNLVCSPNDYVNVQVPKEDGTFTTLSVRSTTVAHFHSSMTPYVPEIERLQAVSACTGLCTADLRGLINTGVVNFHHG